MGVKLDFNNFRAKDAQRVRIEELRLILKDGACEETSPNGPRASVDVPVHRSSVESSNFQQNFARVLRY